jgi:hypothetical protein
MRRIPLSTGEYPEQRAHERSSGVRWGARGDMCLFRKVDDATLHTYQARRELAKKALKTDAISFHHNSVVHVVDHAPVRWEPLAPLYLITYLVAHRDVV